MFTVEMQENHVNTQTRGLVMTFRFLQKKPPLSIVFPSLLIYASPPSSSLMPFDSDAKTETNTHTHIHSSYSAVNEDSEQFASQRFQQLSIVEFAKCDFELQDVVFQNVFQDALVRWHHLLWQTHRKVIDFELRKARYKFFLYILSRGWVTVPIWCQPELNQKSTHSWRHRRQEQGACTPFSDPKRKPIPVLTPYRWKCSETVPSAPTHPWLTWIK